MNKERERIIFLHDIPGGLDDENESKIEDINENVLLKCDTQ